MQPQPANETCARKQALIYDIRLAMNTVVDLNRREMAAVMRGNAASLPPIKAELREARMRKDSLLEEYYSHVRKRCC